MSIKITVHVGDILYHSIGGIVLISTIAIGYFKILNNLNAPNRVQTHKNYHLDVES